jgi:hypothetical protein
MKATIIRERKGLYWAIIKFVKSGRDYDHEPIFASCKRQAKKRLRRMYPGIRIK